MSENDLIKYVLENAANPTISTDTGMEAAREIAGKAKSEGIECALAGGIAMHLYGSPRLTKDVDMIAEARLSLKSKQALTIGGESYEVKIGKYKVVVDWIVRSDAAAAFYNEALREAAVLPDKLRLVSPEWLVIMKLIAGRQKDFDDIVFLLKRKNLIKRPQVKKNIVRVGGELTWSAFMGNFRRLCDLADGRESQPDKYYDNN